MTTGNNASTEAPQPVKTSLLDRAASVARFLGGLAQAAYYVVRTWLVL